MAKGSLRVNGIIVSDDSEITASSGDSIVIREDDGSAVITVDTWKCWHKHNRSWRTI